MTKKKKPAPKKKAAVKKKAEPAQEIHVHLEQPAQPAEPTTEQPCEDCGEVHAPMSEAEKETLKSFLNSQVFTEPKRTTFILRHNIHRGETFKNEIEVVMSFNPQIMMKEGSAKVIIGRNESEGLVAESKNVVGAMLEMFKLLNA